MRKKRNGNINATEQSTCSSPRRNKGRQEGKQQGACEQVLFLWELKQVRLQRTEELLNGWENDSQYGDNHGLNELIRGNKVDVIVGGPPCQAYSVAGRIRDEHGMQEDYRNYLFESYLKVVDYFKPKAFVFENVPGILSAKPGDGTKKIIDLIQEAFAKSGYAVLADLSKAVVDMSEYGVPQRRDRIIILGLSKVEFSENTDEMLNAFYQSILPGHKTKKRTVRDAIGDLPVLLPLEEPITANGKKLSHSLPVPYVDSHISRFHSQRDIQLFRKLEEDIASKRNEYTSIERLKELYTELTGRKSNLHKYYVLRWNEQSNLIPAHLYKDGLRHIHPDPEQSRTITVREAARLQTFDDDFLFECSQTDAFKMIGNAVPPLFAKCVADSLAELLADA